MRVLVCGGRHFGQEGRLHARGDWGWSSAIRRDATNAELLTKTLDALPRPVIVMHGGASGADTLAGHWARFAGVPVETYKADWYPNGFGKLDRSAGQRRNARMIAEGKPDLVIAFEGGAGTAEMVRQARAAGIEVREVAADHGVEG